MAFVLDQTKPNQKYFEAICGIPHPSTEEKAVSNYVCSVAEKLGLNYEQDKFWNVIVRKPASKGYEDAPVVMLEGHAKNHACSRVFSRTPYPCDPPASRQARLRTL